MRLLYIGESERDPICLLPVDDAFMYVEYVALSHCWGSGRQFMTTKATLQQKMEGISFAELPKTFQDAIVVSRALRVQYLWIDSLCIIQDDR